MCEGSFLFLEERSPRRGSRGGEEVGFQGKKRKKDSLPMDESQWDNDPIIRYATEEEIIHMKMGMKLR